MNKANIYAFADEAGESLDIQIKAMHRNGLQGLEIRNCNGKNCSDLTLGDAKEIKKQLDEAGLVTWSMGSPIGKINIVNDDFNMHLEKFKNTIEVGNALGAKNIRLFSFYIPDNENYQDYKNEVIERMGKMCDIASGSKIDLCHENEKGIYGDVGDRCLEILKTFPQIKGVFDPANFVQCGEDTLNCWNKLKNYIKYMHIKDAFYDGSVVPAGKGEGNLAKIVKDYIALGGRDFTVEPHLTIFSGLNNLEHEGNKSIVASKYNYPDSNTAFDVACNSFKELLTEII